MLVLTRRVDGSIIIGDPKTPEKCIEVTVVEVRGDQVRIGVQAPRSVSVDRKEIWEQKQKERKQEDVKQKADADVLPRLRLQPDRL